MKTSFKVIRRLAALAIAVFLALIVLPNCFATVPVGSTGIMLTMGKVEDTALPEGMHFKIPFVQRIVSMDNRVKKLELSTEAFSKDIQTVSATLAVNYRLQTEKTFEIYKTTGTAYEDNLIVPATHEVLKSVCAQYTAEELISKRAESSDKMRDELDAKLSQIGISITDFNIIDFDFSDEFISAVESKQVAEQLKKKAATENETAIAQAEREKQVSIKQSEAEAERVRIAAEAQAQSTLIAAQAEADAVKLAADAEAYRLEQIGKQLTDKTILNTLADNWNGELPGVIGAGAAGILNLDEMVKGGAGE
ncbi:MAG: prohibitin family protein [Clostridiales bacterium]|nr:prohibitin family protein [Clostridiales bacterium]MCI7704379.1 prohibitin family protein [Clostridiales bacterium]